MRSVCYILIGPPNSGKSTWAKKKELPIISCDQIRSEFSGSKKYVFNPKIEKEVWNSFYSRLWLFRKSFIVDNTNCKLAYINKIKESIVPGYVIEYIWFDVPLWKLYYRNVKRWIFNDKFIPFKVIRDMRNNFNKLKQEYEQNMAKF